MDYQAFKARLVMGSFFTLNTKDHERKPLSDESKHNWFVAFAVPKGPQWDAIFNVMHTTAVNDPLCGPALCGMQGFNWKIEDCDAPDNPKNLGTDSRPAGHMLIKFTRYKLMGPPPVVDGSYQPIINPSSIKCGDYFLISASTKFNGAKTVNTNAGMYQNINGAMFAEAGEAIISEGSFDAASAFAGMQGGTVSNSGVSQVGAPVAAVTPAHDLVKPGAAIAPPPPLVAVEPKYNVAGHVYTKTQLVDAGYTDANFATMTPVI